MKTIKIIIATILLLFSISVFIGIIVKSVHLKQNCTGYLERASNANTVELAHAELSKAIDYLEINKITSGYTSVFYKTPDEDISFWYRNLKQSQKELELAKQSKTMLEKTNVLMKLRETLVDIGKDGDSLTIPNGLSRYPNNTFYAVLLTISSLIIVFLMFWVVIETDGF